MKDIEEKIKYSSTILNFNNNNGDYEKESLVLDEYICENCGLRYELCTCSKKK